MQALSLAIVGIPYANKKGAPPRSFELAVCAPGEPVELRPEPKNPADQRAIAVYSCRGIQLGYLKAERAWLIGRIMAEGREVRAIFQGLDTHCGWCRVAFDGAEPVLPEGAADRPPLRPPRKPPEGSDPDAEWWPDEEWPD